MIEFDPVRFFVTLQEEMLGLVDRYHLTAVSHNFRRPMIAGLQHALRTQHLETLVITIGGAARGVDLGKLAADCTDGHRRRIGVVGLGSDRRVGQGTGRGIDGFGLFAEDPAEDVEIMDQHVLEDPA